LRKNTRDAYPAKNEAVARLLPKKTVVMPLAGVSARSVPPPSLPCLDSDQVIIPWDIRIFSLWSRGTLPVSVTLP
jgi:hypothetical protein